MAFPCHFPRLAIERNGRKLPIIHEQGVCKVLAEKKTFQGSKGTRPSSTVLLHPSGSPWSVYRTGFAGNESETETELESQVETNTLNPFLDDVWPVDTGNEVTR